MRSLFDAAACDDDVDCGAGWLSGVVICMQRQGVDVVVEGIKPAVRMLWEWWDLCGG